MAFVFFTACTPKTSETVATAPLPIPEQTPKSVEPLTEETPAMNEPDTVKGLQLQFAMSKKTGSSYNVTD